MQNRTSRPGTSRLGSPGTSQEKRIQILLSICSVVDTRVYGIKFFPGIITLQEAWIIPLYGESITTVKYLVEDDLMQEYAAWQWVVLETPHVR